MLDSLVANLLNKFIGKYVANIDANNLNVSIFGGDVELSNLQLRPEALAELNLPIEVKAGYVGHLKLDIPWTDLFSADVDVAVEDVYILAGPITDRQYDHERERQLQNAVKRQMLAAIEKSALEHVASKADEDPTLFEKLTQNFINRIQVSIRHIHIRYEDTVTNPDHPFACGIMLKQILLCSTDAKWKPKGTDTAPNMLHKLLKLDDLSVYWNPYIPEQHLLRSRLNTDGWRNLLQMSIDSHSIFEEEFDFIIEPVTAQARLIVCTENGFSLPKVFAEFTIEEIEVLLSRQQFQNLLSLNDSFQMMRVNQRYRKYHPNVLLKVSPRSWWLYAYRAVLEEIIRPFSWERMKKHRSRYKKYKNLYKKSLERGEDSYQAKLYELEEKLDVVNILIARQNARKELSDEAPERVRKTKKSAGWFSSWFASSDDEEEIEVEAEYQDWLNEEEREKLYKAIGYNRNSKRTKYPSEYVAHKVQVVLKSCCVSLVNYSKKILQTSVSHLITTWENKPGGNAYRISCNTESFSIEGASIEHELIPILTSDIGVYAPSVNQVFTVDFEVNPLYREADYSLNLNVQPVEIVYDEHSLSEVSAFFQVPQGSIDLKSTALSTFQQVGMYSRAGLQYAIEQHTTFHIALNMRSPYIVIPEFGTLHRGGNVLIVDFGTLRIESELQPKDVSLEDATMSEIESRLYDQFTITIKDVKVLLADSGDDWHTAQILPNSEFHVLPSVQLLLTFFNAVKPDYKQLPRQKFEARIPSLEINVSDKRLLLLLSFFRNFPVPASTSMVTLGDDCVDGLLPSMPPVYALDLSKAQIDPDISELKNIKRMVLGRYMVEKEDLPNTGASKPTMKAASEVFLSASDHSDEELEHFSDALHIKPVDDNSSKSNTVNRLLRMSLNEFVINVSKVMDKHVRPYLMLRVDRLRIDSSMTEYGYAAYATLGGIQVVDKIHVGASGEYMEVLRTESSKNLMSVMYRMVDPLCPDFAKDYNSLEHAVKVRFHSVSALLDQASLMYLQAFVQGLITSVQSMDMKTSTSSVISTSDVSTKDRVSLTDRLTSITDEVDSLPALSTKLYMTAELDEVTVRLSDSDNSLAQLQISGLDSSMLVRPTQTILRSRLKNFSIQDCSVGAIYPKILMIQDENLFDIKLVKYKKRCDSSDNKKQGGGIDYSISLHVGRLQTVFLGKFYWELVRFFEPFVNRELTESARQAAVETVQRQVEDIQAQNLRISVKADLLTPTILVPRHSKSVDILMVQLGNVSVKNYFDFSNIPPDMRQEWNHIYCNLDQFQIESVRLNLADEVCEILHTVLEPVSFQADVRLAMKPVFADTRMDISGRLDKVKVNILQKDLQLLFGLVGENFYEGSPTPSPGMYESPTIQNLEAQASIETETTTPFESRNDSIESEQKSSSTIYVHFNGLSAMLFEDRANENGKASTKTSLCSVDMEKLSFKAVYQSDGDLKCTYTLHTMTIDDKRPDSPLADRRVLFCPQSQKLCEEFPLISLIYKVSSDGNQKADLMVEKVRLNVHLPLMQVLWEFYTGCFEAAPGVDTVDMPGNSLPPSQWSDNVAGLASNISFNICGSFKQPEIVMLVDPCVAKSRAFVIYCDVTFEYRTDAEQQVMWSEVSNMYINSVPSAQSPTTNTTLVMAPCTAKYSQKYNTADGVQDMSINLSKVKVYLCATVMAAAQDLYSLVQLAPPQEPPPSIDQNTDQLTDLWKISTVTSEQWLKDKADYGNLKRELRAPDSPEQTLKVDVKEVCVFFEIINLDHHVPILCLRSCFSATLNDWAKQNQMYLSSEVDVDMMFYNEKLSTWEPLIEPVMEKEGVYRPWEVLVKAKWARSLPMLCIHDDSDMDVVDGLQSNVHNLLHRGRVKSSSSETESDSSADMTVIKHKPIRRIRHGSDRSYGPDGLDEVDARLLGEEEEEGQPSCLYIMVSSMDRLQLNVTPQGVAVLQDVTEALTSPSTSVLCSVREKPSFEIVNKLGLQSYVTLHPEVKVHEDHLKNVQVYHSGVDNTVHPADYEDDIEVLDDDHPDCPSRKYPGKFGFVQRVLGDVGHTLVSAGAFVFEDEDDYLSGENLDLHRMKLQVEGFEQMPSVIHKHACRRILPLTPVKSETNIDAENGTKYCVVLDIDMWHGRKVVRILSPLNLVNQMTMAVDVFCKTEDVKRYRATQHLAGGGEYSRLATVNPHDSLSLPLFIAYHCPLYLKPADLEYELTYSPVWWQDMLQGKEKSKHFLCLSTQEEKKSFNFQVLCKEGDPLHPAQVVPKTLPYYTLTLQPPVTLHNYLPYDLQFSLQGTTMSSSLTHGESTPLYTVDLHNSFKLFFSLTDYLGSDWTGSLDVSSDLDKFKAISMDTEVDAHSSSKHLSLSIHADHSTGLDLHIYTPYWVVNKTQLPLLLRGSMSDAVLDCGLSTNPVLFRYKKHKRKKAKLRVDGSRWSQSFCMDTVGSSGLVVCHDKERGRKYMLMVQSQMSRLRLTKIITVLPFFLVINQSGRKLRYMEENPHTDLWLDIPKGDCQPFWPVTETFNMYIKYDRSNLTSQHFPIKTPHTTVLRMDRGSAMTVEVTGGTDSPITIIFRNYTPGDAPVRVENLCEDVFIKIHQKNQSQVTLLSSNQRVLYTWDEPCAERTIMWNVYGHKKASFQAIIDKDRADSISLKIQSLRTPTSYEMIEDVDSPETSDGDESGDELDGLLPRTDKPLAGKTRMDGRTIYWISFFDTVQRVLLFTQDERIASAVRKMNEGELTTMAAFVSLDGALVSVVNSAYEEVAVMGVCSSPTVWEVKVNNRWKLLNVELATWLEDQFQNEQHNPSLTDQIEADLDNMQMSKPFMGALRRTYHPGVWFKYSTSEHHTAVHAKVQRLQIDNQLSDAYYPIVLSPAPLPSYVVKKKGPKPFIELGFMRRTVPEQNVDTMRYLKVLVQEFNIRLDKGFLLSLSDVFYKMQKEEPENLQLHLDLLLAQRSLMEAASVMMASRPQKIYFENLHLSPLKMRVSFSLNGTAHVQNSKPSSFRSDIVDFFLASVGATLTEITDVELRLAYFQQKGVALSWSQVTGLVQSHYSHQAMQQAYVLVLGLDVLGNPYGLVRDFTQGLGDFFYEPFLGSIQGTDEFADGLSRGIHSLMGNTVGGAAGSLATVTGTIGNALAVLSFDSDYRRKRRSRMQQQPRNLPDSLAQAGRSLVMGVGLGFSGIILDPVKGAHEDGVEGFFKGVGKGILGLITKPAGGVIDMVSMAFDGLRRAAEMEGGVATKVRLPRFINPSKGLRPYSAYRSAGQSLLRTVKKGELGQDLYWAHCPLNKEEKDVALITTKHVMLLERCRFWSGWDVEWCIDVDAILGIPAIHDGKLIFRVKQDDSGLNLFTGGEQEMTSSNGDILVWIQKQVELLITQNQQ